MKKGVLIFIKICFTIFFLPYIQSAPLIGKQDPLVQEAFKIEYETIQKAGEANYWLLTLQLKELRGKAQSPESKAIISALIIVRCLDLFNDYVLPSKDSSIQDVSEPRLLLNTFWVRGYLQMKGLYNQVYQWIQDGTWTTRLAPVIEEMKEEYRRSVELIEEYDPTFSLAVVYNRHTNEFYYTTAYKTRDEIQAWRRAVWQAEAQKIVEEFRLLHPNEVRIVRSSSGETRVEFSSPRVATEYWSCVGEILPYSTRYYLPFLSHYYEWSGDFPRALYYQELYELMKPELDHQGPLLLPGTPFELEQLQRVRKKFGSQLRSCGNQDILHPFLYINDKPLNPKKGFTKGGEPYVSVLDFSKAIGASAEWEKTGKLLKIKSEDDTLLIANIRGQWKVYTEEGKRDINAYLKDGELYLPLKELCKLLNLELKWDEETFIAHVFKK